MAEFAKLLEECSLLPEDIAAAAQAVAHFSAAFSGHDWTQDTSGRWRPSRENFITLKPQWKQARSLAVTLRGNVDEFDVSGLLPLLKDQNGYCAFKLEKAEQIAEALRFVDRARILFERGRTRERRPQITTG